MYASVHTDRGGRLLVSNDHGAAGMDGPTATVMTAALPLPEGSRLVPLPRDATAMGRSGRIRALGPGRLALAALLPHGYTRLLFPAYRDDADASPLDPLPYAAVGAVADGDLVVAAARTGSAAADETGTGPPRSTAIHEHPASSLARQLARCARDHACVAAQAGLGRGDLPIPLGAPPAEAPRAPVDLRSGYAGTPLERAAFRPTAAEIAALAVDHLARGGTGIAFGRACDGEPLVRIRVLDAAVAEVRERAPNALIHLETSGSDPDALRRALDAGVTSVTVRLGSARPETYEALHAPTAHRWSDVRACLQLVADRRVAMVIALLVLPGVTDRPAEIDAIVSLLGDLPGGRLDLRDLGADPLRTLAVLPRGRAAGVSALLGRLAESDHFVPLSPPVVAVS